MITFFLSHNMDSFEAHVCFLLVVEAQTGMLNIDYYHETTDLRKVTEVIKKSTNGLVDIPLYKIKDDTDHFIELLHSFGFQSFARILTERSRYELYVRSIPYAKPVKESSATNLFHKVHVDIDQVKYLDVIDKATGRPAVYTIGEIELLQNCTNKSSGEVMKDIFHRLSIHPTSTIRGKVLEYLYRYQRHHYDILVESGLIGKKLGTINSTTDDIGDNATSEPNTEYKDLSPARELLQNTAVNIHFSRKCNYECNFCFHTAKSSDMLSINEWNQIISSLKKSGVEKLNFAGGEPFLQSHRKLLGEMIVSAKSMGIQSVSVITNASQMKYLSDWFQNYAKYLDILGVSLDTLSMDINKQHGRYPRGKINEIKLDDQSHLNNVRLAARICNDYGIKFKINTVVTSLNKDEDISSFINEIKPFRWKIFQVLPLQGENYGLTKPLSDKGTSCSDSKAKLRDVTDLLITDKEFQAYIDRHSATVYDPSIIKPESNDMMQSSYILIDEYGRFLDSSTGSKIPTDSILDIGINNASEQLLTSFGGGFNRKAFHERDGYYPNDWSK